MQIWRSLRMFFWWTFQRCQGKGVHAVSPFHGGSIGANCQLHDFQEQELVTLEEFVEMQVSSRFGGLQLKMILYLYRYMMINDKWYIVKDMMIAWIHFFTLHVEWCMLYLSKLHQRKSSADWDSQERHVRSTTDFLVAKNVEIENAVNDARLRG